MSFPDPVATDSSKSELAYGWLRRRITDNDYAPGRRLVLGPIADALEMSAVPVREAIRRLEAEGLVTFERNVGARVAVIDEQEYVFTMQTLGLVEGAATALSAPLLSTADLRRADGINRAMRRMLTDLDPKAFTDLNHRFHTVLYEACPNPHLLDLVHRGWSRLSGIRDSTFSYVPERASHSVDEHDAILALLRAKADPLQIELAARDHRQRTSDAFVHARHQTQRSDPPEGTP